MSYLFRRFILHLIKYPIVAEPLPDRAGAHRRRPRTVCACRLFRLNLGTHGSRPLTGRGCVAAFSRGTAGAPVPVFA
jgi:hypothetical protein